MAMSFSKTEAAAKAPEREAATKDVGQDLSKPETRLPLLKELKPKLGGTGQPGTLQIQLVNQNKQYKILAKVKAGDINVNKPNLTALKKHYENQIPFLQRDLTGGKAQEHLAAALTAINTVITAVTKFVGDVTPDTKGVETPFAALAGDVGRFLSALEDAVSGGIDGWTNSDETPIQPPDMGARKGGMKMVANFGMMMAHNVMQHSMQDAGALDGSAQKLNTSAKPLGNLEKLG